MLPSKWNTCIFEEFFPANTLYPVAESFILFCPFEVGIKNQFHSGYSLRPSWWSVWQPGINQFGEFWISSAACYFSASHNGYTILLRIGYWHSGTNCVTVTTVHTFVRI